VVEVAWVTAQDGDPVTQKPHIGVGVPSWSVVVMRCAVRLTVFVVAGEPSPRTRAAETLPDGGVADCGAAAGERLAEPHAAPNRARAARPTKVETRTWKWL
jgi:hypothetical protein